MSNCSTLGWCSIMSETLNDEANAKQKGLSVVVLYNMKTHKRRVAGICYRTSSKDRGTMLNVCPWCKEDILWDK